MREAQATIDIPVSLDIVWGIVADLEQYGAWNPFVVRMECRDAQLAVGSQLQLHVRWPDGGHANSLERVTRLDPPSGLPGARRACFAYRFEGLLQRTGMVSAERTQWLDETATGTRYATVEAFGGLLQAALPMRKIREGFVRHAAALAARAEQLAAASSRS